MALCFELYTSIIIPSINLNPICYDRPFVCDVDYVVFPKHTYVELVSCINLDFSFSSTFQYVVNPDLGMTHL